MNAYLRQFQLPDVQNDTIYQHLDNHYIRQMCYLPLHLSMLIYIATTDGDTLELVDTETELYTHFLSLTIKQYEKRRNRTAESLKECFIDSNTHATYLEALVKLLLID